MKIFFSLFFSLFTFILFSQDVAILKYKGGGDWYSNPTALPNLVKYCNDNIDTNINENIKTVETGSTDIFQFPLLHMTGHGNVFFSDDDAKNLRNYLISGGFLHIDDNYGMEPYVTKELKKVFPNSELIEIPNHHLNRLQKITKFLALRIISQMVCLKSTNTMAKLHKPLVYFMKAD